CAELAIENARELEVAITVTVPDAGDGSNDGGGSRAQGFGEFSGGVRGEKFVDGDLAFFGGDAHLAQQSQGGVASNTGKDRAGEGRSNRFAFQNKEDVHHAGL